MREKLLLLPSASYLTRLEASHGWVLWARRIAIVVGVLVLVMALADVTSTLLAAVGGEQDVLFSAFAPAASVLR